MSALRQRLTHYAALVLLLWLFATGVAFAHTCTSEITIDCEECCVEMKAVEAWTDSNANALAVAAAQPALEPPAQTAASAPAWHPAEVRLAWNASPPDPGGGDIPIVFLRLAL